MIPWVPKCVSVGYDLRHIEKTMHALAGGTAWSLTSPNLGRTFDGRPSARCTRVTGLLLLATRQCPCLVSSDPASKKQRPGGGNLLESPLGSQWLRALPEALKPCSVPVTGSEHAAGRCRAPAGVKRSVSADGTDRAPSDEANQRTTWSAT